MTEAALGFVGLGVMGEPMCGHLIERSGLPVYGYDRAVEPMQRLAQRGMHVNANPAELGRHTSTVFLCLANAEQVEAVCFGETGLLAPGHQVRTIIDCSTSAVAFTRRIAVKAGGAGVQWVDAPVARGRAAAQTGTLCVMVGAAPDLFERVLPLLRHFGPDVVRCGETGCGQAIKILNNKIVIETVNSLAEALAIGRRVGLDGGLLFEVLAGSSADSRALRTIGMQALLPNAFPRAAFPTTYARKDMALALELAADVGIEAALGRETASLLDRAITAGFGEEYYPVFLRLVEAGAADAE